LANLNATEKLTILSNVLNNVIKNLNATINVVDLVKMIVMN